MGGRWAVGGIRSQLGALSQRDLSESLSERAVAKTRAALSGLDLLIFTSVGKATQDSKGSELFSLRPTGADLISNEQLLVILRLWLLLPVFPDQRAELAHCVCVCASRSRSSECLTRRPTSS